MCNERRVGVGGEIPQYIFVEEAFSRDGALVETVFGLCCRPNRIKLFFVEAHPPIVLECVVGMINPQPGNFPLLGTTTQFFSLHEVEFSWSRPLPCHLR